MTFLGKALFTPVLEWGSGMVHVLGVLRPYSAQKARAETGLEQHVEIKIVSWGAQSQSRNPQAD